MTTSTAATPLSAPLYGASFGQAISRFFKKYATFSGRASRSEFWWWYLFNTIIAVVLYVIAAIGGFSGATISETGGTQPGPGFAVALIPSVLWLLATFVPWLALAWRRLHDTNRSGGWYFIGFIPLVGGIILLVFFIMDSDPAGERFDR
ncbi:hypothetical protein ASE14_16385 [Agromyces sp. Root81]|uniref:DUF805 domain-containing protein n=1 Tax=Agromyces sp. Root81 TaxID=1736601 RepID=UPI0006FAE3EF|nr:DUF805 domain-containing protein [Agromyces sp. Root81]KRC59326.1 hypothetical protein ASE14_16385 [Agromyces sp. Root81]